MLTFGDLLLRVGVAALPVAARESGAGHLGLVTDAIAGQMRAYPSATVDRRWDEQIRSMEATVWWGSDEGYLEQWGRRESTEFPEEAEALTAEAQEFMARRSIDAALLAAGAVRDEPGGCRIGVDAPYEASKTKGSRNI